MRVIMSYQPNTLAQQFTVTCCTDAAVLRKHARAGEHLTKRSREAAAAEVNRAAGPQ